MSGSNQTTRQPALLTCAEGHRWAGVVYTRIDGLMRTASNDYELRQSYSATPGTCPSCARTWAKAEPIRLDNVTVHAPMGVTIARILSAMTPVAA